MEINIVQIVLISLFAYLSGLGVPWALGLTGGYYTLGRPLVAGFVVGIIMGDITTGILMGVAIQAVYIALITPGGVASTEISYATYPTITIALVLGVTPEIAVTMSVALGTLGLVFFNITQTINCVWSGNVDKAAAAGDVNGIFKYAVILPTLVVFVVRFFSTAILIYLGASIGEEALTMVPPLLLETMTVLGGVLPALGIAILLATIIHNKLDWIYYIVGFILVVFLNLNILAVAMFGILFAILNFNISTKSINTSNAIPIDDMEVDL